MKKLILLIIVSIVLLLPSCSFKHIEDTNGPDDYSLCSLTDDDFVKGHGSLSVGSITRTKGKTTTISVNKMSGISNLKTIRPKGKTISITVDLQVESGNVRIVLMRQKEIIYEFKLNTEDTYTISLSDDVYNLRLGGESTKFKLVYTVE